MQTLILLLVDFIIHTFACGTNLEDADEVKEDKKYLWNMSQWDAWKSEDEGKSMTEWIEMYKNMTSQSEGWENIVFGNPGFPKEWKAYGEGLIGVPPPPWAYVPNNYGRPAFCFQFPAKGTCNGNIVRWGFNPTTQRCHQFIYSGCGANDNNFKYKSSCLRACASVPSSPCETEGSMDFVDMLYGYSPPMDDNISATKQSRRK